MDKLSFERQICNINENIAALEKKRKNLEIQYSTIVELSKKINIYEDNFHVAIQNRKSKLESIDNLTQCVKSALKYKNKMQDMLNGNEYINSVDKINELKNKIQAQKEKILYDLHETEEGIDINRRRLSNLKNAYIAECKEKKLYDGE